jgi:transposase
MPRAYSEDLRRRVVADTDQGLSIRAVAQKYSVSPSFGSKLTRVWRREGSVASRQIGGYKRHALAEHAEAIRRQLAEQTDMTLVELRDWAQAVLSVRVHLSSVDRFLRSLGYRYKKNAPRLRTRPS